MNATDLTQEERDWGRLYAWLHRRAEYLRQNKNTSTQSDSTYQAGKERVEAATSTKSNSQRDKDSTPHEKV